MSLVPYVKLYRLVGRPPLNGGAFSGTVQYGKESQSLINELLSNDHSFDDLLIDGIDFDTSGKLPKTWKVAEFTVRVPASSGNRFHNTISEFITNTPSLSRGEMLDDFYIVSDNYYSRDGIQLTKVGNLSRLCYFIKKLSELAHYHDRKTSAPYLKLVFIKSNDGEQSQPVELITKIDETMLENEPPDVCLIDNLCNGSIQTDPHFNEKKGVFGVTLTDFLKIPRSDQGAFAFLLHNWSEFLIQYQNNLNTYISGFAFHKAKKEIAQTELQIADQFSKVIGEITGKVLSIPISLVAVIAIVKADSFLESMLLILGLLIASLIISGAVRNQQFQLNRIGEAKKLLFNSIEGRKDTYPKELQEAIDKMISNLNISEQNLRRLLWGFRIISWFPAYAGAAIFLYNQRHIFSWWFNI